VPPGADLHQCELASIDNVFGIFVPPSASFDGFRIVQISDLHDKRFGGGQSALIKAIQEARPDMIAITGDLVGGNGWKSENSFDLIRRVTALAPVYFVSGNHENTDNPAEFSRFAETLEEMGVRVLRTRSEIVSRGEDSIAVAGIDDIDAYRNGERTNEVATEGWNAALLSMKQKMDPKLFTVLLSHRPEFTRSYVSSGFDVVLAGHAHGGQIRLPFVGAIYSPGQGFMPKFTSGMHMLGETTLIVSRGLGGVGFPFRFLNRPEIVIVELKSTR
jgi:uncharacterized protein